MPAAHRHAMGILVTSSGAKQQDRGQVVVGSSERPVQVRSHTCVYAIGGILDRPELPHVLAYDRSKKRSRDPSQSLIYEQKDVVKSIIRCLHCMRHLTTDS